MQKVLTELNRRTDARFRLRGPSGDLTGGSEKILARLREGYTPRDLRLVVWDRCHEWLPKPDMRDHLTPETLFRPEKFDTRVAVAKTAHERHTGKPEVEPEPAQPAFKVPGFGGGKR